MPNFVFNFYSVFNQQIKFINFKQHFLTYHKMASNAQNGRCWQQLKTVQHHWVM